MSNYHENKSPRQMYAIGPLDGTERVPVQHPDTIQVEYTTTQDIANLALLGRDIQSFAVPTLDSTIELVISARETIVTFEGALTDNFTINSTVTGSIAGDRVYIFVAASGPVTIAFTGDLVSVSCGNQESYEVGGDLVCLEMVYSGTTFVGIDNC